MGLPRDLSTRLAAQTVMVSINQYQSSHDVISTYKGIFMLGNCLSGANELSSKGIRLSMVDCWIECCNSDHLVKYLGS